MKVYLTCAVILALLAFAFSLDKMVLDEGIIARVNSNPKASWVAGENEVFKGKTFSQIRNMLGVFLLDKDIISTMPRFSGKSNDIPKEFDSRTQWNKCDALQGVRDQGQCGSCWAFSGAEVLGDRFCVANSSMNFPLSPQDMVSCDSSNYGCQGGYLDREWQYMTSTGIVSDECFPYKSGSGFVPQCPTSCSAAGGSGNWVKYKVKAGTSKNFADVESAQTDMMTKGPIQTGFKVYQDFFTYKSGVYHHVTGGFAGGHAVKIVGWGVDDKSSLPYWIVANSWGTGWGMNGFFWIERGNNECDLESNLWAGDADN